MADDEIKQERKLVEACVDAAGGGLRITGGGFHSFDFDV